MACNRIDHHPNVFPGWLCCSCNQYNGYQRADCRRCGHLPCYTVQAGERLPVVRPVRNVETHDGRAVTAGKVVLGRTPNGITMVEGAVDPPPSAIRDDASPPAPPWPPSC